MLTIQELAKLINQRIRSHIEASICDNPMLFSEIDRAPRNGLITWDEYYSYFLKNLGIKEQFVQRPNQLDRRTQELLMRDKSMWNEAARSDSFSLTLDEFLAFRHPGGIMGHTLVIFIDFRVIFQLFSPILGHILEETRNFTKISSCFEGFSLSNHILPCIKPPDSYKFQSSIDHFCFQSQVQRIYSA